MKKIQLEWNIEKLRGRKNRIGVEGSRIGGNSQHWKFKKCEDEKSSMSSRVAKRKKESCQKSCTQTPNINKHHNS